MLPFTGPKRTTREQKQNPSCTRKNTRRCTRLRLLLVRPMQRTVSMLLYCWIALACASAGQHDELAAWAKRDCDDYRAFVMQINRAQSAHELAAAMRENVRRQRETITTLLQFVRSHP